MSCDKSTFFSVIFLTSLPILLFVDGFPATENWLKRNQCGDLNQKNAKAITIVNAYLEFFNWNFDNEYPEIVAMVKDRIIALVQRAHRVCILTSIIAIASSLPIIGQNAENKRSLLQQIEILLQNFTDDKYVVSAYAFIEQWHTNYLLKIISFFFF